MVNTSHILRLQGASTGTFIRTRLLSVSSISVPISTSSVSFSPSSESITSLASISCSVPSSLTSTASGATCRCSSAGLSFSSVPVVVMLLRCLLSNSKSIPNSARIFDAQTNNCDRRKRDNRGTLNQWRVPTRPPSPFRPFGLTRMSKRHFAYRNLSENWEDSKKIPFICFLVRQSKVKAPRNIREGLCSDLPTQRNKQGIPARWRNVARQCKRSQYLTTLPSFGL